MIKTREVGGLWRRFLAPKNQKNEIYTFMILSASNIDLEMKSTQLEQVLLFANQRQSLGFDRRLALKNRLSKLFNHQNYVNIRDSQFGGASRDINTALPRASPQKDPTPDQTKNPKEKELRPRPELRRRTRPDKEPERQRRRKTKNQTGSGGAAYTYHDCSGSRDRLIGCCWWWTTTTGGNGTAKLHHHHQ